MPHPQVRVKYKDELVEVDEGIAGLLQEIWQAGIETVMSCQGSDTSIGKRRIWIVFDATADVNRFIHVLSLFATNDLRARLTNLYHERSWDYEFMPADAAALSDTGEEQQVFRPEPPIIYDTVSVRFPAEDHDEVLRCLKAFNAGKKPNYDNCSPPAPETKKKRKRPQAVPA